MQYGTSLQEAMVAAISKHQQPTDIMPQITSTLHWLLYFRETLEADVDPNLKQRNSKVVNKIVTVNNKSSDTSFASTSLQSDSVTFVSGADSSHENVASRIAHNMITTNPEYSILRLRIVDHMEYLKSLDFETVSGISILEHFVEVESDISFMIWSQKIKQNRAVIFVHSSILYDIEAAECSNKLILKLYALQIPLYINVNSNDLKCSLSEVTCYVSKNLSFIDVMPQNRSTLIQKLKAKLKWSSAECNSILDKLDYKKNRMIFENADFFMILLHSFEYNQKKMEGNLFHIYELYIQSIVQNYLKNIGDNNPNSEEFILGVFSQAALLMYGDSISKLYPDEINLLNKFSDQISVSVTGQIKFSNSSLAAFLVVRKFTLLATTKSSAWKSKITWDVILPQPQFRTVRCFLNSFLEWNSMPQSVEHFRENLTKQLSVFVNNHDCLLVACEEGNYALFKVISNFSIDKKIPKENLNQYLRLASRSHERLAQSLLQNGADIWSVLEKYLEEGLLHCVAVIGAIGLMKTFLDELRKIKKSDLHLAPIPSSSQEDYPPATPDDHVKKFVHLAINSREKMGCAPIHSAAENGHTEMVKLLLANGADASLVDNWHNQWTPLHYAVLNGHQETAEAILVHLSNQKESKRLLQQDLKLGLNILLEKGSYSTSKNHDSWLNKKKKRCRESYEDLLKFIVQYRVEIVQYALLGRNVGFLAVQKERFDILLILRDSRENIYNPDLEGETLLHVAAEVGNVQAIQFFRNQVPMNAKNNLMQTPLDVAASKSQVKSLKMLLNYKAAPSTQALCYAASRIDRRSCELLLEAGATFVDPSGHISAMHELAMKAPMEALKLLVELGANPCDFDSKGNTPLHLAVSRVDGFECVKYLLELGVPVDARTVEGRTPLHIACMHNALKLATLLLDHGADHNQCDIHNFNALHHSAASYNCLNLILSRGNVFVEAQTDGNKTVIELAEMAGSVRVLNALYRWIAKRKTGRETILMTKILAARKRMHKSIKMVPLPKLTTIKKRNKTSLHEAVKKKNLKVINKLLDKGVSINLLNAKKQTPLHIAVEGNSFNIVKKLLEHPDTIVNAKDSLHYTPLHYAAREKGVRIANMLLDRGADIHAANLKKQQPLHLAIENENDRLALTLLEKGAHVNVLSTEGSPLHIAAEKCDMKIFKRLLELGADRRALDGKLATPLHRAAAANSIEKVKLLLKDGDEKYLNAKDCDGNTPAHLAGFNKFGEMAQYLLSQGADPQAENLKLQTPPKIDEIEDTSWRKRAWDQAAFDAYTDKVNKKIKDEPAGTSKM